MSLGNRNFYSNLRIQSWPDLPVNERRADIAALIAAHPVVIVCGETGSGKTTQLPKICLDIGLGSKGLIGHTQPRRLAARSVANRLAQELQTQVGAKVGLKIRFHDRTSPESVVKLMTDGILLAETQSDPDLRAYEVILIDEAHERSLNIDFLLGYLKQLLERRPDLKVIITSATIDADRFSRHFKGAPVVEVSGRLYPVEVRYRPVNADDADDERDLYAAIVDAVDEVSRLGQGDVLVFLPGEREIREATDALRKHRPAGVGHGPAMEVLPLFSRLSAAEQDRIFKPSSQVRRVILATNVAETSLTVPGIRYVVDSGLARVKRYSYRNKVEQLQIEKVSQAAARQRAGRCGRVSAGVCIRLYDEADFNARTPFTDPEILRSSLAGVILRMQALRLTEVEHFPFIEPPPPKAISDAYGLLQELGALDEARQLTPVGKSLSRLPLDPKIARMIVGAKERGCLKEILVIAAALSVQDPRERPQERQQAADEKHRLFADEKSEFLSWLKLWAWVDDAFAHKHSTRKLIDQCHAHFLSWLRLREWREVHSQLVSLVHEQDWRENTLPATYEAIHKALLTGLLGNIGCKSEDSGHYLGARGMKFLIHPGSPLQKKAGKWIVAAEITETTRLYARCVARIDPVWLEEVGGHLIRRSYFDPHWEKKAMQVVAWERSTLHGLVINPKKRVHYGPMAPSESREIFIRQGLVGGEIDESFARQWPFYQHNQRLIHEIEHLEHKQRRQDVLVDEELMVAFYDQRIPAVGAEPSSTVRAEPSSTVRAKSASTVRAEPVEAPSLQALPFDKLRANGLEKSEQSQSSSSWVIHNGATFDVWRKTVERTEPRHLFLEKADLMRHEAAGITTEAFPPQLQINGVMLALSYHFEPGSPRDGVTLTVPLANLNPLSATRCEWLVPGLLKEKVVQLVKTLPQKIRAKLVPVPDFAAAFVAWVEESTGGEREALLNGGLVPALIRFILAHYGLNARGWAITPDAFRPDALPAHFHMNFKLVDELGRQLEMQRNLGALRASWGQEARQEFVDLHDAPAEHRGLTDWTFGPLPELMEVLVGKQRVIGFPGLVDAESSVDLKVFDTPEEAQRAHKAGLLRLFRLHFREQAKYFEKNIPNLNGMGMAFMPLGSQEFLRDQIIEVTFERACLGEPWPVDAAGFKTRCLEAKPRLGLLLQEVSRLVWVILVEWQGAQKKLMTCKAYPAVHSDVSEQMKRLVSPDFVRATPFDRLQHLPRYLKAVGVRLEKLRADPARDARCFAEYTPLWTNYVRRLSQLARQGVNDPQLDQFRWLLEELRVSLFAQELRTPTPVSVKRLQKMWEGMGH